MASGATSKYALPYPQPADAPNIPADVQALAAGLDAIIATAYQGTAASRPSAGKAGRSYLATDTGALSLDTGSAWLTVGVLNTSASQISTVTPGEAGAAGTTGTAADAGHVHPAPAFSGTGDITASQPGQAAVAGSSGRFADGAHQHAREAWGSTPATVTPSSPAGTAGTSSTVARGDHQHPTPAWGAAGDIGTLAFGGSALAGSVGKYADAGHKHAMPAVPTQLLAFGTSIEESILTISDTNWHAVDSTNMKIAFVAPASGKVLIRVSGTLSSTDAPLMLAMVTHGTTNPIGALTGVAMTVDGSFTPVAVPIHVTGLLAGTSYTLDVAAKLTNGSGTVTFRALQALSDAGAAAWTIEAWSA